MALLVLNKDLRHVGFPVRNKWRHKWWWSMWHESCFCRHGKSRFYHSNSDSTNNLQEQWSSPRWKQCVPRFLSLISAETLKNLFSCDAEALSLLTSRNKSSSFLHAANLSSHWKHGNYYHRFSINQWTRNEHCHILPGNIRDIQLFLRHKIESRNKNKCFFAFTVHSFLPL